MIANVAVLAAITTFLVVAWLAGRTYLVPDDVQAIVPSVLGHRVFFTPVYELRRAQIADALVAQILERVPTPR